MKRFSKLVINNLFKMFTVKRLAIIAAVYIFLNFITNKLFRIDTFIDLITFSFYGGKDLTDRPIITLTFIAVQVLLMYINLSFIHEELNVRIKLIICRIKSKNSWINGMFISILIFCFIYFFIGIIILILLNRDIIQSKLEIIYSLKILILLVLWSFSISLICFLLIIIIKKQTIIFTIIVFMYYIAISIEDIISKYFIFSQGVLAKHYFYNITFKWSCYFSIIISMIMYVVIRNILLRRDVC